MAREPSRAQLSKLAYDEHVPAFLQRLKARISGQQVDEDEPSYAYEDDRGQWEESGDGRPAIPRRPGIPERPSEGKWGSNQVGKEEENGRDREDGKEQDEEGDDAPQIVVLKQGKHLSAEEVENEHRAAKGLPPLPKSQRAELALGSSAPPEKAKPIKENLTMNFSSSKKASGGLGAAAKKRKTIGADDEGPTADEKPGKSSKKPKKEKKGLLSFQDDDG